MGGPTDAPSPGGGQSEIAVDPFFSNHPVALTRRSLPAAPGARWAALRVR
jgi:hypothetical protein